MNETIRTINAIDEEVTYIKQKFIEKADWIDMEVRVNIKELIKILAVFKCYYGINGYRKLDLARNDSNTMKEYLRYSKSEA